MREGHRRPSVLRRTVEITHRCRAHPCRIGVGSAPERPVPVRCGKRAFQVPPGRRSGSTSPATGFPRRYASKEHPHVFVVFRVATIDLAAPGRGSIVRGSASPGSRRAPGTIRRGGSRSLRTQAGRCRRCGRPGGAAGQSGSGIDQRAVPVELRHSGRRRRRTPDAEHPAGDPDTAHRTLEPDLAHHPAADRPARRDPRPAPERPGRCHPDPVPVAARGRSFRRGLGRGSGVRPANRWRWPERGDLGGWRQLRRAPAAIASTSIPPSCSRSYRALSTAGAP